MLAALPVVAGCDAAPTSTLRTPPTVAPTPAPPLAGPHMMATLTGISLVSADEGWIVGRDNSYNGIGAFLLRYHHGSWRLEAFPALVDPKLATPTSITMVAPDSGWIAITLAPDYSPVILHETAGSWAIDRLPASAGVVTDLSAPTPHDAWALSTSVDPASGTPTSAILRDRAGQWAAAATFPGASLTALSMDSADDGWAVGSDSRGPVLLHDAQGTWARVTPVAPGGIATLTSVFMASPSLGWATGLAPAAATTCTECGDGPPRRVVLHFRDGHWQPVQETSGGAEDLPNTDTADEQFLPDSVAAGANGSGWVARDQLVEFAPDGHQQVFTAACKTDFLGLALVPVATTSSAPEGWVIGSHAQLFHLVGDALTRYDTGAPCDPLS